MLFIVSVEIILRVFGLASDVPKRELNDAQMILFKPHTEGYFVRGMRKEVSAHFSFNEQGWNSLRDYSKRDSNTIAIIGDSYVTGLWNDVDSSISYQLEYIMKDKYNEDVIAHNYGHPGASFVDYETLIPYLKEKGYKNIVVHIGYKDFLAKKPSYVNKKSFSESEGGISVYRKSALLRYLNINLNAKRFINGKNKKGKKKEDRDKHIKKIEDRLMKYENSDIAFLYDDDFFDKLSVNVPLLKVKHKRWPYNHGFNRHWNVNGNLKCSRSNC